MKIHHEELSDVHRYIKNSQDIRLEDKKREFDIRMQRIKKFKVINKHTRILEIGTGTGWFPILCKKEGIYCKGLEISPQLIEYAKQYGHNYNIHPDIEVGNIEDTDIGMSQYDVIIADSVFEHVERWQTGLKRVFNALKPGGLLYFISTNKFSIRQTEHKFPFYGWLPDNWRYSFRKYCQGEDIMKLGIDFNQFTPFQLRRFFKNLGFSIVLDWTEFLESTHFVHQKLSKKIALKMLARLKPLRVFALVFSKLTIFICLKR